MLATDFSSNAHTAALCAGEFASRLGSRLIVFHALSPLVVMEEAEESAKNICLEETVQKKLDKLAHELYGRFGISVSRLIKPGFAGEEIIGMATNLQAELVILGAQGENQQENRVLGTIASDILQKCNFPVVCVPQDHSWNFHKKFSITWKKKGQLCNDYGLNILNELNKWPAVQRKI